MTSDQRLRLAQPHDDVLRGFDDFYCDLADQRGRPIARPVNFIDGRCASTAFTEDSDAGPG